MTGIGQREVDIAASNAGAYDFLDKDKLTPTLLERAIRYSIMNARARAQLANQSAMLEATLDAMHAGVATFNSEGDLVAANSLFLRTMKEACSSLDWFARGDKDSTGSSNDGLVRLNPNVLGDEELLAEFVIEQEREFEIRKSPIPDIGSVVVFFDVTNQKMIQRKMLEAKKTAETASKMKSSFLAKVSHELRTPLNGIIGMGNLLLTSELDQRQHINLTTLLDSAGHLMNLIEEILDLAIIEKSDFEIQTEEFILHDLVIDAKNLALAGSQPPKNSVDIVFDGGSDVSYVGDRRRIVQVISIFLSNALKFASKGKIEIITEELSNVNLKISVIDNGPGIEEEEQERIFTKFSQVGEDPESRSDGFGIGLSIASELVAKMNGEIGVSSEVGTGSCFWMIIPVGWRRPKECLSSLTALPGSA